MPFFSRFKNKGAQPAQKSARQSTLSNGAPTGPQKPKYTTTWSSKTVEPEEVEELIRTCTAEMKSRAEALDAPFLLLPFRPATDASGARTFIRNFYKSNAEGSPKYRGTSLEQELRLTEPAVLCSIIKWVWSRIPDGVVSWPVYEAFQIGEKESNMDRNAFDTFIPLGADSTSRKNIIFDFFDLIGAVAAHGKMNGLGGRKLSRLAGWWAFEHSDDGKGFEGGYKSWTQAADASSHLFFAYLRSLSPEADQSKSLIERIPRSLQSLLASTEYPPETPALMQIPTPRVVMMVDSVSPTPFALLRRAKHFEYRDRDQVLREFSEFEDPIDALTEECKRVLFAVSSTNSSIAQSKHQPDESWSAFSNMGFADIDINSLQKTPNDTNVPGSRAQSSGLTSGLRSEPRSRNADRPTTPSWADFLSSGFVEEDDNKSPSTFFLPPDQSLPPIGERPHTTTTQVPKEDANLSPGELAAIANVDLDDTFWWVWMISLSSEEPQERKGVFGRCAVIETSIQQGRWLIMEEQVKGASPDPEDGVYIAPKKNNFLSTITRGRLGRKKSDRKKPAPTSDRSDRELGNVTSAAPSKVSLAPDQQSKIKQAAEALKKQDSKDESSGRRGRQDDPYSSKTNSVLTMGLQSEAGPALKWMGAYDKNAIRAQYLGDSFAGRGVSKEHLSVYSMPTEDKRVSTVTQPERALSPDVANFAADPSSQDLRTLPTEGLASSPTNLSQETQPPPQMPPSPPDVNAVSPELEKKQVDAENVPVPEVSSSNAMDKEVGAPSSPKLGRKPVPSSHPAFRQQSPDDVPQEETPTSPSQNVAAIAAAKAMETSPESNKNVPDRSKPQASPPPASGLKKMFTRRKDNRQSAGVTNNSSGLAPPTDKLSRRLSLRRNKPSPAATPKDSPVTETREEPEPVPVMPASLGQFENSSAAISTADSVDQRHAEQEFSRFDQGPVDMPAFVPQTSPEPEIVAPQAQRKISPRLTTEPEPEPERELEPESESVRSLTVPTKQSEPIDTTDAQSEATMDDNPDSAPEKDRWATIRENAARRAARASEEQSRPSQSQRTEDGETSGEETIESRVARIKARVAELTGGMENASGTRR